MIIPTGSAFAAGRMCASKSFVVANWKGEVPPTDEVAEPVNEPKDTADEHSGDDAKREAKPAEPEDEPNTDEQEDDAPPVDGTVESEGSATVDDANHEGERPAYPTDPEGEQPKENEITPAEEIIAPQDEQPVVETTESELPANGATDEPAPAVDDMPEDDSESEPVEGEL